MTSERFRLFIAIQIPDPVKAAIESAQRTLCDTLRDSTVRWTTREQFHLTLRFLGNVKAHRTDALAEALRSVCSGFGPLTLCAKGIGFFPGARMPRVAWVGVRDNQEQLPKLQRSIELATRDYTNEPSEKDFAGHVTLCRFKSINRRDAESMNQAANRLAQQVFGEWTVEDIDLIRSELSPAGPKYTVLAAAKFGVKGQPYAGI
jgi:RNA 2',3'-cyclic 3'-phosphodiesterase